MAEQPGLADRYVSLGYGETRIKPDSQASFWAEPTAQRLFDGLSRFFSSIRCGIWVIAWIEDQDHLQRVWVAGDPFDAMTLVYVKVCERHTLPVSFQGLGQLGVSLRLPGIRVTNVSAKAARSYLELSQRRRTERVWPSKVKRGSGSNKASSALRRLTLSVATSSRVAGTSSYCTGKCKVLGALPQEKLPFSAATFGPTMTSTHGSTSKLSFAKSQSWEMTTAQVESGSAALVSSKWAAAACGRTWPCRCHQNRSGIPSRDSRFAACPTSVAMQGGPCPRSR